MRLSGSLFLMDSRQEDAANQLPSWILVNVCNCVFSDSQASRVNHTTAHTDDKGQGISTASEKIMWVRDELRDARFMMTHIRFVLIA